jgi:hypothetical protein
MSNAQNYVSIIIHTYKTVTFWDGIFHTYRLVSIWQILWKIIKLSSLTCEMIQRYKIWLYMAVYGCIWLYTAVYSHIQDVQKVDFCIQIIWVKRLLDEMVLDDMKGTYIQRELKYISNVPNQPLWGFEGLVWRWLLRPCAKKNTPHVDGGLVTSSS